MSAALSLSCTHVFIVDQVAHVSGYVGFVVQESRSVGQYSQYSLLCRTISVSSTSSFAQTLIGVQIKRDQSDEVLRSSAACETAAIRAARIKVQSL